MSVRRQSTHTQHSKECLDNRLIRHQQLNYNMSRPQQIRGGGYHYVTDYKSPEGVLFRAGLKQDPAKLDYLVKGRLLDISDTHDKIDYDRGTIIHSRSMSSQYFNFHWMFGGFKNYFFNRWVMQHFYRRNLRIGWPLFVFGYAMGCYGMRVYDNAAYNFFYFSD